MVRSLRTFIAAEMSAEVRTRARQLAGRLQATDAKVAWAKPETMHLTFKFLGEVDLIDMPAVCAAVTEAVAALPPFEIELHGAGAFPTAHRPRTIWLGVGRGQAELVELHDAIDRALSGLGYRPEQRRFRPHLTVGRVRGGRDLERLGQLIVANADYAGGVSSVDEVVVFSSELEPEGPLHEPLAVAPLNGR